MNGMDQNGPAKSGRRLEKKTAEICISAVFSSKQQLRLACGYSLQ